MKYVISALLLLSLSYSCSTTKHIPEGNYLLDEVSLKMDTKEVPQAEITTFIQQKPNDPKFRLRIYNLVKGDSSKWLDRTIRKIGEPPVIYSEKLMKQSIKELTVEMKNRGYLEANVTAKLDTSNKKAHVSYSIQNNEPYRIRNYQVNINDAGIDSILTKRKGRNATILKPGVLFDMDKLETERDNVSRILRNQGYYDFTQDNLHYLADTTLKTHQVDLSLILRDSTNTSSYRINSVTVLSGFDPLNPGDYNVVDSVKYKNIQILYNQFHFLRPSVINSNVMIRPGGLFRERRGEQTYNYFNNLGNVGRVNIQYEKANIPDSSLLDCKIYLTPGNIHSIQTGLEGTNKAGDLGVAVNVAYGYHNLFNGAEWFNIKLKGAYEFVSGSSNSDILTHNFYEFGINPTLTFPKMHLPFIGSIVKDRFNVSTQYGVGFDIQKRPEYTRDFFNLNWKVLWSNDRRTINQSLSLIDINYVMMPAVSDTFRYYLDHNVDSLTKYSYEDVFTAGIGYGIIYTNSGTGKLKQRLYTIRFNAETSGNALNWIFNLAEAKKSATGQYNILGNPFAQYTKGDLDFSQTIQLNQKVGIAMHAAFGMAYPYGNSTILPFEKRYYAGGSNSIRGWSTRYLGPGSYNGGMEEDDPTNHVGDMTLTLSAEYRYKWIKWLELAAFIDAGNIWTIRNYSDQPGGQFDKSSFYKEIAIGTGVGLRFDLSFLILRIDGGTRVYDPALPEGERWMFLKKNLGKNSAFYLAIGYPF